MIYTVNSSKNCVEVALFRAYIRRKPSGLLLVTVLSAALPRPVFRSYPLDIGEAAAVERSVGHALAVVFKLEGAGVKLGVNHPVMPPHADQQSANECYCQPANNHSEVKSVFQHSSPHGLHQPRQYAEVDDEQQAGADGYAVKGGHLVAPIEICSNDSKEESQPSCTNINPCYGKRDAKSCAESSLKYSEFSVTSKPIKGFSEPTQHLRLRVVWQGLL